MKYIFFLLVLFGIISCGANKPIIIQQFYPFNKMTDTSYSNNEIRTSKEDYFLVSNFKDNNSTIIYIDSFVGRHINKRLLEYNTYRMYFYKESRATNLIKIAENPRELDRYSRDHDLIFKYDWDDGKFRGRIKIKNGEQVEPAQTKLKFTIIQTQDSVKK